MAKFKQLFSEKCVLELIQISLALSFKLIALNPKLRERQMQIATKPEDQVCQIMP
jgi:hypothetical protein